MQNRQVAKEDKHGYLPENEYIACKCEEENGVHERRKEIGFTQDWYGVPD